VMQVEMPEEQFKNEVMKSFVIKSCDAMAGDARRAERCLISKFTTDHSAAAPATILSINAVCHMPRKDVWRLIQFLLPLPNC
jgi:hypothetical protein